MNVTFTFAIEQVRIILAALDAAPHGQVRPIIDHIVNEVNAQQHAAMTAAAASREEVE